MKWHPARFFMTAIAMRRIVQLQQRQIEENLRRLSHGHAMPFALAPHSEPFGCPRRPIGKKISTQNRPEAILMVKASSVVLKKKASTQCTRPVLRMVRLLKLTSAVCPEVPMTQAKYRKSP